MIHELTAALQEVSEKLAGKMLPVEICWLILMILIKRGGMVSSSARAVRLAQKREITEEDPNDKTPPEREATNEFDHRRARCVRLWNRVYIFVYGKYRQPKQKMPYWVKEDILEDHEPCVWKEPSLRPYWPYVSKEARLKGITRGDFPHWDLPNHTLFDRTARGRVYYITGTYEGPCHRCGAKSTLVIEELDRKFVVMLSIQLTCACGHVHRDYMEICGIDARIKFGEPVRAYLNTLGIELRGIRQPGEMD